MRRLRAAVALPLLLASIVGAAATPSSAEPLPGPIDCPDHLTVDEVKALPKGTELGGFTVSSGVDPEPFTASLLGVMDDAVAPGRSMIVVEASSSVIDDKGIWAGMSGSPVYLSDELVGAVAFGLTFGPSSIAGLTPAEDMFELPGVTPPAPLASLDVPLTRTMERRIAAATSVTTQQVGDSMTRLPVPLAVSGGARVVDRLGAAVRAEGLPLIPYGASSRTTAAEPVDMAAGGSLGAGLSFGDVTVAGVGTTTFVCDGNAVGFGHPMFWTGPASLGATGADTLTIVDGLEGSFKLANLTANVGEVVQDRLAGIVAELGDAPPSALITSDTAAVDTGRTNAGETEVVQQDAFPFIAYLHTAANIDSTFDLIGRGSAELEWTVSGTRRFGEPWTMTRTNRFVSFNDIAFGAVDELLSQLAQLHDNGSERIRFTGLDVETNVREGLHFLRIRDVLSSKNGTRFRDREVMRVRRGQQIWFKIVFDGVNAPAPTDVVVKMRAPGHTRKATVRFKGGAPNQFFGECFFMECGPSLPESSSFDDLLDELSGADRNDQLTTRVMVGSQERRKLRRIMDAVVRGKDRVRLVMVG